MVKKIRIVLVDDHPITLNGLRMLIEADPGFDIVAEATSGPEALERILAAKPDVAILDISLPRMNGIELARRVAKECPSVGLIALTSHEDKSYLNQALDAGVRGYVLKKSTTTRLLHAVRGVLVGGLYVDPAIAFPSTHRKKRSSGGNPKLTEREGEVIKLVARGLTNKEIAFKLDVSPKSVETYRARGAAKMGLKTRSELVRYASLQGWLSDL